MRNHESMRFGYATQAQLSQSLRFRDRVKAKGDFRPSWFVFFLLFFCLGMSNLYCSCFSTPIYLSRPPQIFVISIQHIRQEGLKRSSGLIGDKT